MYRFEVHTFGGEIEIEAHHFVVNKETGEIEFYKSETEKDDSWRVFLHGVSAIKSLGPRIPATVGELRL